MENILSYKLEGFEGPLDLLLQLIARNKYNIYDIPAPYGKDINDYLCYKLGLKNRQEIDNYKTEKVHKSNSLLVQ